MPRRITPEERRQSLLTAIANLPSSGHDKSGMNARVEVDFLIAPYSIVREAARSRKLTTAAYVRRAAYAMACHDLGLPIVEATSRDPRMTRHTGFMIDDPEAVKFGPWEIEKLRGVGDAAGSA